MNETDANSVMTVREISEFLRLTEATVYKLLHEGKLPGRKVGGQWRCSRRAIEGWLGAEDGDNGQLKVSGEEETKIDEERKDL